MLFDSIKTILNLVYYYTMMKYEYCTVYVHTYVSIYNMYYRRVHDKWTKFKIQIKLSFIFVVKK